MATRSYIGIALSNGNVKTIYCHYDGYLSYVGSVLKEHYTTVDQVNELINGGDMSSLGETINETKFYAQQGEASIAEELTDWRSTFSDSWCEYFYLFNPSTNKWYYAERESDPKSIQLKDF